VSIDTQTLHRLPGSTWLLAQRQHGVVSRRQLLSLGWRPQAIKHRVTRGRLHPVRRGVYAVGRPALTRNGHWMAAVLLCGPEAFLSHQTAAQLWGISTVDQPARTIHLSVPAHRRPGGHGIRVHRVRRLPSSDRSEREGIPVTAPIRTIIDLAGSLDSRKLERLVNEADKVGLIDPESLRRALGDRAGQAGVAALRALLDGQDFRLTDSELETRFLRLILGAGLPRPLTQQNVNGFRVDFFWPELRLIVETDGLRYHRTATQQSRDRARDQRHVTAGLVALRFTHFQVTFEASRVVDTLRRVAERQRLALLGAL
jgi:very-short-patch-repair endonuclease